MTETGPNPAKEMDAHSSVIKKNLLPVHLSVNRPTVARSVAVATKVRQNADYSGREERQRSFSTSEILSGSIAI
jgi:hypothetical protein